MAFVLSIAILSYSWLLAQYSVLATNNYFSYEENIEKSQKFWNWIESPSYTGSAKKTGKYLSKDELDTKIKDVMKEMPDATDEEIAQAIWQLKNEWFFFEWINDHASSEQYRLNLAQSTLWNSMTRLVEDFGFIIGSYLIWLWNLMSGTINWDLREFLKWLIVIAITTIFVGILMPTISIVIKYVGCSLRIFPQLFRIILWPIRSKLLSLWIILLPPIFISRSIIHEASLIWVLVEIWIFLVNIVVMWILLSMIKDASVFIKNKKFIEKVRIWFQE